MLFGVSAALRWIGWHVIVFNFFGFLFFDPVGLRELYFFFVVIFWTPAQAALLCGLWWFVLLVRFGLFTALILECCSEIFSFCGEFDPGSGRTLAACLTHASRTERPVLALVLEWRTGE